MTDVSPLLVSEVTPVPVLDDGWCLFHTILKSLDYEDTPINCWKLACELGTGILADPELLKDVISAATPIRRHDKVYNEGNVNLNAGGIPVTGYITQNPWNSVADGEYYALNDGDTKMKVVLTPQEYAASLWTLRNPGNVDTGPLIWADIRAIAPAVQKLFKLNLFVYQANQTQYTNIYPGTAESRNEHPYVLVEHSGGNHYSWLNINDAGLSAHPTLIKPPRGYGVKNIPLDKCSVVNGTVILTPARESTVVPPASAPPIVQPTVVPPASDASTVVTSEPAPVSSSLPSHDNTDVMAAAGLLLAAMMSSGIMDERIPGSAPPAAEPLVSTSSGAVPPPSVFPTVPTDHPSSTSGPAASGAADPLVSTSSGAVPPVSDINSRPRAFSDDEDDGEGSVVGSPPSNAAGLPGSASGPLAVSAVSASGPPDRQPVPENQNSKWFNSLFNLFRRNKKPISGTPPAEQGDGDNIPEQVNPMRTPPAPAPAPASEESRRTFLNLLSNLWPFGRNALPPGPVPVGPQPAPASSAPAPSGPQPAQPGPQTGPQPASSAPARPGPQPAQTGPQPAPAPSGPQPAQPGPQQGPQPASSAPVPKGKTPPGPGDKFPGTFAILPPRPQPSRPGILGIPVLPPPLISAQNQAKQTAHIFVVVRNKDPVTNTLIHSLFLIAQGNTDLSNVFVPTGLIEPSQVDASIAALLTGMADTITNIPSGFKKFIETDTSYYTVADPFTIQFIDTTLHPIALILENAGEWIERIEKIDRKLANKIRILLKKLNLKIAYPAPEWAKPLMANGCETTKHTIQAAVEYSQVYRALDSPGLIAYAELFNRRENLMSMGEDGKAELAQVQAMMESYYGDKKIFVRDASDSKVHLLSVPNPYAAASYREDAKTTFANPAGSTSAFDPSGTMFKKNIQLVKALVPPQLLVDKKMTIAILESLWYCGSRATVSDDPRCFPIRFLNEFRDAEDNAKQMSIAQAVEGAWEWPFLQKIIRKMKAAVPTVQDFAFDPDLLPPKPAAASPSPAPAPATPAQAPAPATPSPAAASPAPVPANKKRVTFELPSPITPLPAPVTRGSLRYALPGPLGFKKH